MSVQPLLEARRIVKSFGRVEALRGADFTVYVVQTRNVLEQITRVREHDLSVVLISHNMPEVFKVADRIEVLRLGERVARLRPSEVSMEDVVSAMTGALTFDEEGAPAPRGWL